MRANSGYRADSATTAAGARPTLSTADRMASSSPESASYQLNERRARGDRDSSGSSIGSNDEQEPEDDEGQEPDDGT
jgi:hypothetical protein